MNKDFAFTIKRSRFDAHYNPLKIRELQPTSRIWPGENREENLRNTLTMIDNRFNALAYWDNPKSDRYSVELEIISVEMTLTDQHRSGSFPVIEILKTSILDKKTHERIDGLAGNNFPLTYAIMILACGC
jgi:hypothetical protein